MLQTAIFYKLSLSLLLVFTLTKLFLFYVENWSSHCFRIAMTSVGTFLFDSLKPESKIDNWIRLADSHVIELVLGKVDIGQGISTALAQIAAEELDVHISQIRTVAASTAHSANEGVTSGSFSVQKSGHAIRYASATLRAAAINWFASEWQVEPQSISVRGGRFYSSQSAKAGDYWSLPARICLNLPVDHEAVVKASSGHTVVGTSTPRLDLPAKVFGEFRFIQDMTFPDLLHGRVIRAPNRFALVRRTCSLQEFQQRHPEAQLVSDGSFIGVLSAREEQAVAAAAFVAERTEWDLPPALPAQAALSEFLRTAPHLTTTAARHGGDIDSGTLQHSATYSRPFLAHASIGPSCALARWTDAGLEIWCHSQGIFNLRDGIASFIDRVHPARAALPLAVHHVEGAGCYGHNPADDVAFDAVLLARASKGRPVRVLWTRADELSCGPFGPAQLVEIGASLTKDGSIASWHQEHWANGYTARPGRHGKDVLSFLSAGQLKEPFEVPVSFDPPLTIGGGSDRNAQPQYDVPDMSVLSHRLLEMPLRTSALRALGGHPNVFAIESFMDELAEHSGQDPVSFRLRHLPDERARNVIELAIAGAPWWGQPKAEGEGHGIGYARYKSTGAWCAVVVCVLAEAEIRVLKVSAAVDVGLVVNPDGVRNQIEGGIIQSCSWTLKEAVHFTSSEVTTRSWDAYPILTFSEAPAVTVAIADRQTEPSLGAGEASVGPAAAAIGNAVYDALGVRVRDMPITQERVLTLL
jgi:CO/xanthine dehydrogenase Mo-binding subunit